MGSRPASLFFAAALALFGCGGEPIDGLGPDAQVPEWVNEKPILHVASPDRLSVGEKLTVLGEKFIEKRRGSLVVRFEGTFFSEDGSTHPVDYQEKAEAKNGTLTWKMWPDVVFDPTGDKLGRFVGHLTVINQGNDGSQVASDPLSLSLDIKPSLIVRAVQPVGYQCAPVIQGTLEEIPMAFMVEVIGFREATPDTPLTFQWTFMAEQWTVEFDHGTLDPTTIIPETGPIVLVDTVTTGTQSYVQDGGSRNVLLKLFDDLVGSTRLKALKTGKGQSAMAASTPTTVNVMVTDDAGRTAKLGIDLSIHPRAEMFYDDEYVIAERYQPVMVTDCIPGEHYTGTDVRYHETTNESRARSMTFNWNANLSAELRPLGIVCSVITGQPMLCDPWTWVMGINFSVGFGVNVNEHVSTDTSESLSISGHIIPGLYGAFYRQTTRLQREAQLIGYTECGQSVDLGKAVLTDWMFTPDLAIGPECPPPTKLKPAEKFLD